MSVKITVKKRIVVNGKEYQSVEELPRGIREAYEKAVADRTGPSASLNVTFNGQEYDSLEAMPPEIRRLYEDAMSPAGPAPVRGDGEPVTAIEPSSSVPRWLIGVLVAAAAALALMYWLRGGF